MALNNLTHLWLTGRIPRNASPRARTGLAGNAHALLLNVNHAERENVEVYLRNLNGIVAK